MGLYQQPNDYTCGPFALKHALVTLGRLADEEAIASIAHPHWWAGTDEVKLARAARHFECDLSHVRRRDPEAAWDSLRRYVEGGIPVLLCVDDWGHWITAVRHERDRFVVLDSKTAPVVKVMGWPQLRNRWRYHDYCEASDTYRPLFDLHPVKPRFRIAQSAAFSVERAQHLRRPENADLAEHWDEYLEDLLEICRPRSRRRGSQMSMGEFLRRHQELLVSRVCYWHGDVARTGIQRVLRNFRFVAETYALVIPEAGARRALADLSMLLALWAAADRGVNGMYGTATL